MKFVKIPDIMNTWDNVVIKTLSPSSFSWIDTGCSYQLLLQKALDSFNDRRYLLPTSKSTLTGTIVHKIYELSSKKEFCSIKDLSSKWEELVKAQEDKLRQYYPTLQNVDINDYDKRNKCFRYALSIINSSSHNGGNSEKTKTYSEYWIDCTDIGLRGVIDKLRLNPDGIDIIDYKSGVVIDETDNIKKEYVTQLHLYAIMCEHLKLGSIKSLSLVDIDGNRHFVKYDKGLNASYLIQVQQTIRKLNQIIEKREFNNGLKPCESCSLCSVRHICEQRDMSQNTIFTDIIGVVKKVISPNLFELATTTGDTITLSGLEEFHLDMPEQYVDKKLSLINILNSNMAQPSSSYKISNNTIIYEL